MHTSPILNYNWKRIFWIFNHFDFSPPQTLYISDETIAFEKAGGHVTADGTINDGRGSLRWDYADGTLSFRTFIVLPGGGSCRESATLPEGREFFEYYLRVRFQIFEEEQHRQEVERQIASERKSQGLCVVCGRPLAFWEKALTRVSHFRC